MLNAKNSSKITKNSKILIGLTAILACLYFLSFTRTCTSKDSREKIKSSLVNQKYKDSITSFELEDASSSIIIKNEGTFWTVGRANTATIAGTRNTNQVLPASPERIQNLIENLTNIRNLYKISDKITQNSAFGLTNGTEFHLRYNTDQGFHELIFGNQDFSLSSRYLMTEKSTQVYEIDSSLDTYLTSSIQSWAEPYIISQVVLGKITSADIQRTQVENLNQNHLGTISDIQKLLDLRHGGIPDQEEMEKNFQARNAQTAQTLISLELGNKNEIEIQIYKSQNENEFVVLTYYMTEKGKTPVFVSSSKISSWTYNKIKEITL